MNATDLRPFSVTRIDHVVLRVVDIDRSIRFYSDVLGCEVVRRRDDLGLVHLRVGTSMIDLVRVDGPNGKRGGAGPGKEGRNMDHFCLRVDPFDETRILAHLDAHGLDRSAGAQVNFGAEGDGQSIYLVDPDGNVIELKGPARVRGSWIDDRRTGSAVANTEITMSTQLDALETGALKLSPEERVLLADHLLASVGQGGEFEAAWTDGIDRRLSAVEAGRAPLVPAQDARSSEPDEHCRERFSRKRS